MSEYGGLTAVLESMREEAEKKEAALKKEEEKKIQNECNRREQVREARINAANRRAAFSEECLNNMLTKTLSTIMIVSMNQPTEDEIRKIANLCENYVLNKGARRLMSDTRNNSLMLAEIYGTIDTFHKRMLKEADEGKEENKENEDDDLAVDPKTEEEFFEELDQMEDIEDVTNAIRIRVTNAEEKFMTDNIENKMDTEDAIKQTAERLAAIDASRDENTTDEQMEAMKQEATMMGRRKMNDIAFNKKRTIFEQVVRQVATKIVSDPTLLESYSDKGDLNMDTVISTSRCIYTFNEALIVMKLERPTKEFVDNMLKSI